MKRLFLLLTVCMLSMAAPAQSAMIRLSYEHRWLFAGKEIVHDYILHTSADKSMFYNPVAYQLDTTSKDEAARQAYGAMAAAMQASGRGAEVPNRSVSMYIAKSHTDGTKTVYDDFYDVFAYHDEPYDEMIWNIVSDSVRNILGYECIMAKSDYHGRHWTAWFSPEIPMSDGPWKLAGLPGLILEANEASGTHSFIATGIEHTTDPVPEMIVPEWYHKEDRKKYLKAKKKFIDNPIAHLFANIPPGCKVMGSDGTEIKRNDQVVTDDNYDLLETDYH